MNKPIPAAEVAGILWAMIEDAVEKEFAGESVEVVEAAKARILVALGASL